MKSRLGWRKENSIRFIIDPFSASKNSDQLINFVIIRFHIVVADRPVVAKAVNASAFEVLWAKAQGDPPPVICSASQHPGTEPVELRVAFVSIRFAIKLPATISSVEVTKLAPLCTGSASQ